MSCLALCQEAGKQAKLGNWQATLNLLQLAIEKCDTDSTSTAGIYGKSLRLRIVNNIAVAKSYLGVEYSFEMEDFELPPVSKEHLAYNLGKPTKDKYLQLGSLLNKFIRDKNSRAKLQSQLQDILEFIQVQQIMEILDEIHNQSPTRILKLIELERHPHLEMVISALVHFLNSTFYFSQDNAKACCDELYKYYMVKRQVGMDPEEIRVYNSNLALINEKLLGKSQLAEILRGNSSI